MDTFVIFTILSYFFKNSSLLMLFVCEMSFFKLFSKQLAFLMVVIYYHLILDNPLSTVVGKVVKNIFLTWHETYNINSNRKIVKSQVKYFN
jgi:hypothetical protein